LSAEDTSRADEGIADFPDDILNEILGD
jgi:hypothetical protein